YRGGGWAAGVVYFSRVPPYSGPPGGVAPASGATPHDSGAPRRGTFLVGRDGRIAWQLVNPAGERRDFAGYHAALGELIDSGAMPRGG
ncbi:MAG: peroxiredoxin, partial [Janibacter sp.]